MTWEGRLGVLVGKSEDNEGRAVHLVNVSESSVVGLSQIKGRQTTVNVVVCLQCLIDQLLPAFK